jgi:putative copper resistance protein D
MYLFALVRALHFASLMILFGASAFAWLVRMRLRSELTLPRGLLLSCGAVALATTLLLVGFVAGEVTGSDAAFDSAAAWPVLRDTLYGHIALEQMALLTIFLVIGWFVRRAREVAGAVSGGIALALLGLTSHAAAAGAPHLFYARAAMDAAHLLTAAMWTGGLVALVHVITRQTQETARHIALLRLFSRWGVWSVAILVAAGTVNAFAILGVQGMRWSPAYLTLLAFKLVLAALMIALALTNRFGVLPGLARGDKEAAETLPLTLFAELGSAILVIVVVGFLGLTAPMQM